MLLGIAGSAWAQSQGFDQEIFDRWIEMRVGNGETPVYWYCVGEVYSYPDGRLVLRMEGFDTARLAVGRTASRAQQLSRKIFVYRDPTTNEILRQFEGRPVQHIEYPYQFITYELSGNRLLSTVEQGAGARLQTIGPGDKTYARRVGASVVFSAPIFLAFDTPRGRYEAYENYDFWIHPGARDPQSRYQLSWVRYGDLPAFVGPGKAIIQLVSWRVDRFEDLPESLRTFVRQEKPMWLVPPKDIEEIRALQKGQ
jgi:hypothetical protein